VPRARRAKTGSDQPELRPYLGKAGHAAAFSRPVVRRRGSEIPAAGNPLSLDRTTVRVPRPLTETCPGKTQRFAERALLPRAEQLQAGNLTNFSGNLAGGDDQLMADTPYAHCTCTPRYSMLDGGRSASRSGSRKVKAKTGHDAPCDGGTDHGKPCTAAPSFPPAVQGTPVTSPRSSASKGVRRPGENRRNPQPASGGQPHQKTKKTERLGPPARLPAQDESFLFFLFFFFPLPANNEGPAQPVKLTSRSYSEGAGDSGPEGKRSSPSNTPPALMGGGPPRLPRPVSSDPARLGQVDEALKFPRRVPRTISASLENTSAS